MQSVASINSPDLLPAPAPDRKDQGSDLFSQMLDTATAPQPQSPDNSAPKAPPYAGTGAESPPPPRQTESRPADNGSTQPADDTGRAAASCEQPGGSKAVAKSGDPTGKEKDSGKSPKQSQDGDGAKAAAQAVATPDPAQPIPQTATPAAVISIAPDAPKADGGGGAAAGDCAKAAAAEIAAAPAAPGTPNASAGATPPANEGAAQAAAAIEPAAKGVADSKTSETPPQAGDAPDTSKNTGAPAAAEQAIPQALKLTAAVNLGAPGAKPAASKTPLADDASAQPQPASGESTKSVKALPDTPASAPAAANHDLEAATIRPVSFTASLSQPTALPEPLQALASSLNPASAQVQTDAAPQGVPATSAAIAVAIAARANDGSRQFDIRLDPPELGRIDVRLDVDKSGGVSTHLTVDRPETLNLLQNDARGLERALQSAGLKTEDGSLQFSLRQQSPDGSAGQQAQGGTAPHQATAFVDEDEPATTSVEQYQWAARLRGGVDIRV